MKEWTRHGHLLGQIINGEPGDFVIHRHGHGLHQQVEGDPLSPMLFYFGAMLPWRISYSQPLIVQQARHRISFYANYLVVFLCGQPLMVSFFLLAWDLLARVSAVVTNSAKSSVTIIPCSDAEEDRSWCLACLHVRSRTSLVLILVQNMKDHD